MSTLLNDPDRSAVSRLIKYILFMVNIAVFLVSGAVIGLITWVLVEKEKKFNNAYDFFLDPTCALCLAACIAFVISFAGLFGELREYIPALLVKMDLRKVTSFKLLVFSFILSGLYLRGYALWSEEKAELFDAMIKETQKLRANEENLQNRMELLHHAVTNEKNARAQNSMLIKDLELEIDIYTNECKSEIARLSNSIEENSNLINLLKQSLELLSPVKDIIESNMNEKIGPLSDNVASLEFRIRKLESKSPNLALRKPATESSTYRNKYQRGPGSATDGNKDGEWAHTSCSHTNNENNPWWRVDLQSEFYIDRVVITNRKDCCGERLHNVVVTVSRNENEEGEVCGRYEGPSTNGATVTINCEQSVIGRYVKIMIEGTGALTLCEVEVY